MVCPLQLANYLCILLVLGKSICNLPMILHSNWFQHSSRVNHSYMSGSRYQYPKIFGRFLISRVASETCFGSGNDWIHGRVHAWNDHCLSKVDDPIRGISAILPSWNRVSFLFRTSQLIMPSSTLNDIKKNIPFSMMISKGQEPSSSVASWMRLNSLRWHLVNPYRHTASCSLGQDQQESE